MTRNFNEYIKSVAGRRVLSYIDKNPDENIPKLMKWWDKFDSSKDSGFISARAAMREIVTDPENNWYKFIKSFWTDIDDGVRRTFFETVMLNSFFIGDARRKKIAKKNDCNIPWAILIDPTSACNLRCTGCWAAEYGNRLNLSYEELENIIAQANKLGTTMFLFTGGEPLVRKKDIIRLCEAHPDCAFSAFTNGTLIDEEFADEMLRVKNFYPAISVEGFEEATDSRRGKGTFKAVMRAMEILKSRKLFFGTSCCYTKANAEVIGSEEYIDAMINWGAKFEWIFTYMPVGRDAVPDLLATAEQREFMYRQIRSFRNNKPLFTIDFWNDGEYVKGCVAGGRYYCHINANGDVEPCAFIHYSDSNIREKTLLEAYKSPMFAEYRKNQPFNNNHLRPCPLLDNNGALADMVHRAGAKSTDLQNPEDVDKLCLKCKEAAEKWTPVADRLWACSEHYGKNAGEAEGKRQ